MEGHRIADLWSPDYERLREPDRPTNPELAMTIDGERAALDVTMFTTNHRSRAGARAVAIQKAIETRLLGLDDKRSVLGLVVYDSAALIAAPKRELPAQISVLVDAYVAAIRSSPANVDQLSLRTALPWVRGASLKLTTDPPGQRRVSVYIRAPRGDIATLVDQFILERVDKKTLQLAPWGRGILVIVHGLGESAADVRAGFDRLGRCPFWRVYWVGASPEDVELVAASEPTPPGAKSR